MTSASSQEERGPRGLDGDAFQGKRVVATSSSEHAAPPRSVTLPSLSPGEASVLRALSEVRQLSIGVLRSRTGLPAEELREALVQLRAKGLVTRLNTVVESYSSRFPGLRVDD